IFSKLLGLQGMLILLFGSSLIGVFFFKDTTARLHRFRPTAGRCICTVLLLVICILSLTHFTSFLYGGF
ncbi:MAG: hypothetical protein LBM28_06875, partial [Oscillospiraceae bacterium]|nr:hypothetical protein [Oscillospiraceae bacterium]